MKNKWIWSIILFLIVIADSLITIDNGVEYTPLILYAMDLFNLSLKEAMYLRIFYYIPLIYIVHKYNWVRFCTIAYVAMYIVQGTFMYMLDAKMI